MSHHDIDAEREMDELLSASGSPPVEEDPFTFGDVRLSPERIVGLLRPHMMERRLERIREVVAGRTRSVVPVVEGLVNTGNVSAVMRSAEALGPSDCAAHLKNAGYRLVAMHLHADTVPIRELDFTTPTALIFGNEEAGVTDDMLAETDAACEVPLPGFTESFNVSVAAAVALYHAQQDRLDRQGHHADLSDDEQARLVARFCLRSVNNAEQIIRRKLAE
jgi:tRNA (guanosine-2'-O-)-methyltransferase